MLIINGNALTDTEAITNLRKIIENPDVNQAKKRKDFINKILANRKSYSKGDEICIPLEKKPMLSYHSTITVKYCKDVSLVNDNNVYYNNQESFSSLFININNSIMAEIAGQIDTNDTTSNDAA